MRNRLVRFTLLALLIIASVGAAYLIWSAQQQSSAALARDQEFDIKLDAIFADLGELGAAQTAYVAPGQLGGPWLGRVSALLQRLDVEAAAIRPYARAAGATGKLQTFGEGQDTLLRVDARIREYLYAGEELMAADLMFSEARESLASMKASLRELRTGERLARKTAAEVVLKQEASVLGGIALLWLVGLLLLVGVPRQAVSVPADAQGSSIWTPSSESIAVEDRILTAPPRAESPINLARAAEVCGELARLADGSHLSATLATAAEVLDATGVIVWLGAGEQLFAVTAHGYDPHVVARFGPIDRAARNATAEAWREGGMRVVAGDVIANGAIVAPMIGLAGCRGVLAVEVRNGIEADGAAQAVTSMFAAQLAGIVAAWPAASSAESPAQRAG